MAARDQGYGSIQLPESFYRGMIPGLLASAVLPTGHRPPDLTRPFRYADLGCSNQAR